MIHDPIVDEVRAARENYAKQFNFDLKLMLDDLQRRQQEGGRKLVSFAPKRRHRSQVIAPASAATTLPQH